MNKKTFVLGISGGSASGKSTLSKLIYDRLTANNKNCQCEIINSDKYYKKHLPQMISPLTGVSGDDWNSPESIDFDLMYDYLNNKIKENILNFIIIEGAFIFCYEQLRKMLDLAVYVDLDSDIRMYRRIKRNMAVRGLTLEQVADYYTEYAKFSEQKNSLTSKIYADIIVNGNNFQKLALDMLVMYIESRTDNG